MSSLQAQHCLATGAVQHRTDHLLADDSGGELADYGSIMAKYGTVLLGLPRRFVRRLQLPDHAAGLIGLPLAAGGLGYRTWRSTADCAYLAAYMHTSQHFPKHSPLLADRFPPILDLVPAVGQPALAPSKQAEFASRAFVRILPGAPLVRERIEGSTSVMKHTQQVLSTIVSEAEARRVWASSTPWTALGCLATWSLATSIAVTPQL